MSRYKAYSEYKYSGVEWLGEIPPHWHLRQLKYLCSYNDDVLSETASDDYEIEYVDIGSVSAIDGISSTETMRFGDAPSRARRIVRDGDILISTVRTYLEAIASVQTPPNNLIASTGFAVIRPNVFLNKGYAAYCLRASGFIKEVVARSVGVSYPAINASDLVNIKTPEPSLTEQEKIAAFLDHETAKIDALIEKQQRLIELLKEKRQAVISHAVTKGLNPNAPMKDSGVEWLGEVPAHWSIKKLGYLANKIGSGKTPKGGSEIYQDDGVLFLRSQNIYDSGLRLDPVDCVYISNSIHEEMAGTKVQAGDVLLNITGGSIGRSCLVPADFSTANVNQHVCILRFPSGANEFLAFLIKSQTIQAQIDACQTGGNREGLNFEQISKMVICLPPNDEKIQIVEHLNTSTRKFDHLELTALQTVALLQERRTALISAAVTGKIDVRDWQAAA